MKLNISYPPTGAQKCIEIEDDKKLRAFYDKRMSQEVTGEDVGEQFKGYVFKITGGNDKQGFPMKQGVLTNHRVRLLLRAGVSCFRPRRSGERKRKSIRGCIVGPDISVVHLVIVKKGDEEVEGLTDKYIPRRLGPKRATKIRKLFNLSPEDDVRKYVIRREIKPKEGKEAPAKPRTKAPKIQRLVTPQRLQHRRRLAALKKKSGEKSKKEAAEYAKLVAQRKQETKAKRSELLSKRRASHQAELAKTGATTATTTAAKPAAKATTTPVKTSDKPAKTATSGSAPKPQQPVNPKPSTGAKKVSTKTTGQ